jgi:glycosyltransferase involved in cell wall biosynthesis
MNTAIVIPCYNEARRLRFEEFRRYLALVPQCAMLFVDDGSTDDTLHLLRQFQHEIGPQVEVVHMMTNVGKAEAVRAGLLRAISSPEIRIAGFWDADLATPLHAIGEFVDVIESRSDIEMVFGSRVKLLGRKVHRQASRHYLGRVFATAASMVLGLPIYDTQCGAKLFRVTPGLADALREPFRSKWIFDVELIARLLQFNALDLCWPETAIYEFPLKQWTDVAGSKVRMRDFARAAIELTQIRQSYNVRPSSVAKPRQASNSFFTSPWTSVSRKLRP